MPARSLQAANVAVELGSLLCLKPLATDLVLNLDDAIRILLDHADPSQKTGLLAGV